MKQFQILKPIFHNINSVGASQLLRIYAKFPINTNGVWFKNMNRITTNYTYIRRKWINYDILYR